MSGRPRLLDLFCCAGGAAEGYHRAGFDVLGVDIDPQPNYPFAFVQADAIDYLASLMELDWIEGNVAAIHASPPCQLDCAYRRRGNGVGDGYPDLIAATRQHIRATGKPYVIENVEGARSRLVNPVTLCGSSFGLDVRRHRLFESSVPLMVPPCNHSAQRAGRFAASTNRRPGSRATVEIGVWRIPLEVQKKAMGIERQIALRELSEAIPPAYTEHIGGFLMAAVRQRELERAA